TVAVERAGASELLRHIAERRQAVASASASDGDLHADVRAVRVAAVRMPTTAGPIDDRLDPCVPHPLVGPLLLAALMFFIFQAVFSWAEPLMVGIEDAVGWLGALVSGWFPAGSALQSRVADGIFGGLGSVLVFLPQIVILFLFILILEESGYLPRAAFLLDRLMFKAGLTGRAFIPLLSSFACAIPGIMATRSISDPRDRLRSEEHTSELQ